ncbi:hypothetical protein [Pedobacter suwonensis]|uniref:hypothetical protein n=1 Tax=Pedobacter suwonensis TaxID=332999 RepID=UPI0011A93F5F|nr:hypothetical protein [Pedobacter suwonensis]
MTKSTNKKTVQEIYAEHLHGILTKRLFESGSELKANLVKKFKLTDVNARKVISRAVDTRHIKSSSPFTFGKGQFIYILPENKISLTSVMTICATARPPVFRLLAYLLHNDGICSYYDGLKISACPIEESSTKVSSLEDILKLLEKLELVYQQRDENGVNYILLTDDFERYGENIEQNMMNGAFSDMVTDTTLLPDIMRWLVKSNIMDNSQIIYRNKKTPSVGAVHNNLAWDVFSYTKTTGFSELSGVKAETTEKMTLVALDVVLSKPYAQIHLDGFLSRVQINQNSTKNEKRKILPIIVYKECSEIVLNKIKALGFVALDIGSIFGTRIYSIISKLNKINDIDLAEPDIEATINKMLKSIRSAGQEDALKDLKGVLFEILMYPVLKYMFPNASVLQGKTLKVTRANSKQEYYEYDYIFHSSNPEEIIIVELKGYGEDSTISLGDRDKKASLKWFFERTIPFAKEFYANDIKAGKKLCAVYMTSAHFWADGIEFTKKMNKSRLKPTAMDVAYDRPKLLDLLSSKGFKKEVEILAKYYGKK